MYDFQFFIVTLIQMNLKDVLKAVILASTSK